MDFCIELQTDYFSSSEHAIFNQNAKRECWRRSLSWRYQARLFQVITPACVSLHICNVKCQKLRNYLAIKWQLFSYFWEHPFIVTNFDRGKWNTRTSMYGVRNLFSLKSRPSERFNWPEMSQIKAEISLHTNLKLIFHKNVGWQGYQWIPWFL